MTTAVQRRRGTTTEHSSFTGLEGEISVNTTKDTLVVHDGSTVGGFELARADGSNFVASTVDINGGTIDGTTIGSSSASTGAFTTLSASGEITANGGIALGDNDKATFGASDDLQIYHNGSGSYIDDAGTGNLFVRADNLQLRRADGSHLYLAANTGAEVALYHAGNSKLSTTATGIDVTGTVTMDGLSLDNAQYINFKNSSNVLTRSLGINGANTFYIGGIDADIGDILFVDGGTTRASFANGGDISFYEDTGTTAKFFWDASAESLGIGNTAPTSALDVTGTVTADGLISANVSGITLIQAVGVDSNGFADVEIKSTGTSGASRLYFSDTAAQSGSIKYSHSDNSMQFATAATERMRIDASGILSFSETSSASFPARSINAYNNGYTYITGGANGLILKDAGASGSRVQINSSTLQFEANGSERMRIDASGNVGIGTSSPEATVHIQKASAGARGATLVIDNNAASTVGNESQITFLTDAGASVAGIANARIKVINTNAGSGAADLTFTTWSGSAEGERLRIDASGNVGIGVVPSAWSGVTGLQLSTGCSLNGSGVNAVLGANSYYNGTNWKYIVSAFSTNYYSNYANNGSHVWQIAPSGTAGGTITYTHAMTLDASGNLLVGTTSTPSATQAGFMLTGDQLYTSAGASTTTNYQVRFYNGNGLVGAITTDGSATAYLTSSDQRLKENITDANDAGDKIDAIQVRQYDWKADGSHQDYGMVAQELQLVAPEAVSGDADSEEMMGVDYSKLVPMLIKEIQSLRNRVAQLEA